MQTPPGRRFAGRLLWAGGHSHSHKYYGMHDATVRVRALPALSVGNVFAIPSVSRKELTVRVTVRNDTSETRTVQVAHRVFDGDKPAFLLREKVATVPARSAREVTLTGSWATPRLWWPHDPHLYRIRTFLKDDGDQILQLVDSRFGFREFRAAGRHFQFNGRRFKTRLFASMTHPGELFAARAYFRTKLDQARKTGQTGPLLMRYHVHPTRPEEMDAAVAELEDLVFYVQDA